MQLTKIETETSTYFVDAELRKQGEEICGKTTIRWKDGVKHGTEECGQDGECGYIRIPWENGKKHGLERYQYGSSMWKDGIRHGWTRYEHYDSYGHGTWHRQNQFYVNGIKEGHSLLQTGFDVFEGFYEHGLMHGQFKVNDEKKRNTKGGIYKHGTLMYNTLEQYLLARAGGTEEDELPLLRDLDESYDSGSLDDIHACFKAGLDKRNESAAEMAEWIVQSLRTELDGVTSEDKITIVIQM